MNQISKTFENVTHNATAYASKTLNEAQYSQVCLIAGHCVAAASLVIKFPKETMGKPTSKTQLQDWANSKEWSNITHRTYIAIPHLFFDLP